MSENAARNRVVVGIDQSPSARSALDWAVRWAAARHLPLTLLSAVPPILIDPGGVTMVTGGLHEAAQQRAGDHLTQVRDDVLGRHPGLDIHLAVTEMVAAQALVDASETAELVVVGTHARSGLMGRLVGSTADQVATHAKGPVVVVPEDCGQQRPGPVVAGLDVPPHAEAPLRMAFQMAEATDAPLIALHAWDLDFGWAATPVALEQDEILTMVDDQRRRLEGAVAAVAQGFPGVNAQTQIQRDTPGHVLVEATRSASLVVVGSRGRGGFAGLLLGSTSRKVLPGAHCPILVVPGERS